jgi:hypothetical protein
MQEKIYISEQKAVIQNSNGIDQWVSFHSTYSTNLLW